MFHFFVHKILIINAFKRWNIAFQCFIYVSFYVSMFHFLVFRYKLKTSGRKMKTCSKKNQNMLEAISKHARRNASETLKLKMKHPYTMFQLCNLLIINDLKCKNETWNKIKTDKVNVTYARVRGNVLYVYSSGDVTMGKLQFVSHTIHYSSPLKKHQTKSNPSTQLTHCRQMLTKWKCEHFRL